MVPSVSPRLLQTWGRPPAQRPADPASEWISTYFCCRVKPLSVGLVLLFTGAAVAAAWLAHQVLLLAFLGLLIGVVFSFPVDWLAKVMPRALAVILVVLVLAGGAAAVGAVVVPTLVREADELRERAPRALSDARQWLRAKQGEEGARKTEEQAKQTAGKAAEGALKAALGLVSSATIIVLVIALGAFLVHEPDSYRRGVRHLIPARYQEKFDETWRRAARSLRRWLGGILVSMTIMGTLTGLGLALAGVNGWLLLAVLTFLGTFVPYLGAIASAIPGLLAALAQSPHHFLLALLVYLVVHVVEGYIVDPLVMKRAVHIKPALLLFFQAVAGAVFGVTGTVVATPLLVCIQEAVQYLWVERVRS